jgi:hypothetical protein
VNGQRTNVVDIHITKETGVRVEGWAVDSNAGDSANGVFVSIDGRSDFPAFVGLERPDVADHFHSTNYEAAGFVSYIRSSRIPVGEHTLQLKVVSHDGSGYRTCRALRLRVVE